MRRERDLTEDGMGFSGLVPSLAEKNAEEQFFRDACAVIEAHCRSLGKDVQVIFSKSGVEIAPLSDSGSSTGRTLYSTLKECEKWADQQ